MPAPTVLPRSTIRVPEPPASRPKLRQVRWLIAHEVGVNTPPTGRYRSDDPARVLADAIAVAQFGASSGRPWEYNFILGRDGSIFTQAGEFIAAHCKGFNPDSAGVLFANALGLAPTAAQIASWHWLRGWLVTQGVLTAGHEVAPHYRFRSTSCPGVLAYPPGGAWPSPTGEGRTGALIPALTAAPIPPPPPPAEDDDMAATMWKHPQYANVFLVGSGPALNLSGALMASLTDRGVPLVIDAHDQMLKSCLAQSGLMLADLVPTGR